MDDVLRQKLYHLPLRRIDGEAVAALDRYREAVDAYSYAGPALATWSGSFNGRPGLFFVLMGTEHVLTCTEARMGTGLMWPHVVLDEVVA